MLNVNNLGIWSHRKQTYLMPWKRLHEKVCEFWEQAKKIIEKKRILPLTKDELKSHQDAKVLCFSGKFNVPNEIPVVINNGSNYNYHFIIKELADDFERKFECLGENTEKYKTFFVPIEKEVIKLIKKVMKVL